MTLRARWVTLRARWVTLRARWVTFTEMHPPLADKCANLWTFLDFACLIRNPPATDAGFQAVAQATYMPLLRLIGESTRGHYCAR